jgi:hypothetical protein
MASKAAPSSAPTTSRISQVTMEFPSAVSAVVSSAVLHFGAVVRKLSVCPANMVPAAKASTTPEPGIVYVLATPRAVTGL